MLKNKEDNSPTVSPMSEKQKNTSGGPSNHPPIPYIGGIMGNGNAQPTEQQKIFAPRKADVLLGRGKPFQSHPGNQRMLCLVDDYRKRYLQAERREKHAIVEGVMKTIRDSGGRFLIRVDYENYWVEVAHSIAYRKVGHAFRSKARMNSEHGAGRSSSTGSQNVASLVGANAAALPAGFLGGNTSSMLASSPRDFAVARAARQSRNSSDLFLLSGGAQNLTAHNTSLAEAPAASALNLLGVRGLSAPQSVASAPLQGPIASGDIGSRIPFPPPRLATSMDLAQLPRLGGQTSLGGSNNSNRMAGGGVSSFASSFGGLGSGSPAAAAAAAYEPALMYHQQQILAAQQEQQILAQQEQLLLQDQTAFRSQLARAQFMNSLRRQGGDQNDQQLGGYPPFLG